MALPKDFYTRPRAFNITVENPQETIQALSSLVGVYRSRMPLRNNAMRTKMQEEKKRVEFIRDAMMEQIMAEIEVEKAIASGD